MVCPKIQRLLERVRRPVSQTRFEPCQTNPLLDQGGGANKLVFRLFHSQGFAFGDTIGKALSIVSNSWVS
jgi:hypothetical protein